MIYTDRWAAGTRSRNAWFIFMEPRLCDSLSLSPSLVRWLSLMETTTFARLVVCKSLRIFLLRRKPEPASSAQLSSRKKKGKKESFGSNKSVGRHVRTHKTGSRGSADWCYVVGVVVVVHQEKGRTTYGHELHKWFHHLKKKKVSKSPNSLTFPKFSI